jgi:antitoxin component YwqK of YwqJK toxin-antitoxin module
VNIGRFEAVWGDFSLDRRGGILVGWNNGSNIEFMRTYIADDGALAEGGVVYHYGGAVSNDGDVLYTAEWFINARGEQVSVTDQNMAEFNSLYQNTQDVLVHRITEGNIAEHIYGLPKNTLNITVADISFADNGQVFLHNGEPATGELCAKGQDIEAIARWYTNRHLPDLYNQSLVCATLVDGYRNGVESEFYLADNSLHRETPYVNGQRHGTERWYRGNTQADWGDTLEWKIPYANGMKHGVETYVYSEGAVGLELTYVDGHERGFMREYNEDGVMILEEPHGIAGIGKRWYADGNLQREVYFDEYGQKQGKATAYNEWGLLHQKVTFKDSELDGIADYYQDGELEALVNYRGGKPIAGMWGDGTQMSINDMNGYYVDSMNVWSDAVG